eukprot:355246-Chlamydomonas_euryale.AAC.5
MAWRWQRPCRSKGLARAEALRDEKALREPGPCQATRPGIHDAVCPGPPLALAASPGPQRRQCPALILHHEHAT